MTGQPPEALAELRERLRRCAAATAHPELVARLDDPTDLASVDATAVVVGEKKRGKSSVINALLHRPALFPVDVDIATSCYLTASNAEVERATAFGDEAPEGREIPLSDIAEWASVEGNRIPGSMPPEPLHPGVTAVQVRLPHPLLADGLTLVDTPGVGGLDATHADITLAVLRSADAVLFVVDPDSGLRRSELAFLSAATSRVSQVAFVMTKVDRYPHWREVLAENRRRLTESAPAWADSPWFDVSSLIAYDAIETAEDDHDEVAQLWAESGFDRLEAYLREHVAGRAGALRLANGLHQLTGAINALREAEQVMLSAATGDPTLRERLTEQQAALTALLADDAGWPAELSAAMDQVRSALQRDFRALLRNARSSLQDRVNADQVAPAAVRSEVDAALRAVWIEVTTSLRDKSRTVLVALAGELDDEGFDVLRRELAYPARLTELPALRTAGADDGELGSVVEEYMPVVFAAGGAAALLSGVLALVNPFTAIAIGLGAGMARRNVQVQRRERARDRAGGLAYVSRAFEQATDDMGADLQDAVGEVRQQCETTVRALMAARREELESQVRSLKQHVRVDEATAAVARTQAQARLAELDEIAAAAAALVTANGGADR